MWTSEQRAQKALWRKDRRSPEQRAQTGRPCGFAKGRAGLTHAVSAALPQRRGGVSWLFCCCMAQAPLRGCVQRATAGQRHIECASHVNRGILMIAGLIHAWKGSYSSGQV